MTFDPEEFTTKAHDHRGHSAHVSFRVPDDDWAVLINSAASQFYNGDKSALGRHAYRRHFAFLESIQPFSSVNKQVQAMADLMLKEQAQSNFVNYFERLDRFVSEQKESGDREQIIHEALLEARNHIVSMPEGNWKTVYMTEFNKRFKEPKALPPGPLPLPAASTIPTNAAALNVFSDEAEVPEVIKE